MNFSLHSEWNTQNGTAMVLGVWRSTVTPERETTAEEDCSSTAAHEQREVVQAATTSCSEEEDHTTTQLAQLLTCVLWAVRGQEPTAKN